MKVNKLLAGLLLAITLPAYAGISATKHNLGTTGPGPNNLTAGTAEICVFCHTPHGSDTSAAVPLWNKKLPAASTFTTYNSVSTSATSSLDGIVIGVGSVSVACLSCHDGSQAMDNMVNAPGSGGYSASGDSPSGYTWTGNATLSTGPVPMLGKDLTNDHPIGLQYCGGGWVNPAATITAAVCADKDFQDAAYAVKNSMKVWWVDTTGGTANRDKTDMILYTRDFGSNVGPSVECGSCHDPHVETKASNEVAFLRVSQAGSGVCLACHIK